MTIEVDSSIVRGCGEAFRVLAAEYPAAGDR